MQAILILAACAAVASPAAARPNIFGQLTASYTKNGGRGILDSLPNILGNKDVSNSISASLTKESENDGRSGALKVSLEKTAKSQDYSNIASPVDSISRNINPSDYYSKADDVVSNIAPRDYSPSSINREVNDKHSELSLTLEKNLESQDYSNIASPVDSISRNINPSDYYGKVDDVVSNIAPRDYSPSSINREVNDKHSELSLTLEKNLKSQDYSNIASPVHNIPRNIDPSDYYGKADDVVSNIAPRDYSPSSINREVNDKHSELSLTLEKNLKSQDYSNIASNRAGNDGRSDQFSNSDEESWQGDANLDAQLEDRKW